MFIHSLGLRNILSFHAPQRLILKPLNILIGPNGSGKSNLLDCIGLLQATPENLTNYLNLRGGTESWIWKGAEAKAMPAHLSCRFSIGERKSLEYIIDFAAVERTLAIQAESLAPYLDRSAAQFRIKGQRNKTR